ncbi:MAG: HD domain-containing protein [Planctomycetes bacterium]|nr:HD domain-containing protein [Planctomycetota bacterium]
MNRRTKILIWMVVSQAVCLIIGLWLQDRLMLSLIQWNSSQGSTKQGEPLGALEADSSQGENASVHTYKADGDAFHTVMLQARPLAFVWICGLQSVVAYLLITRLNVEHAQRQEQSHEMLVKRAKELVRTRDAVIFGLAKLAESRDPDTGHHLERIALYSTRLATALRRQPRYRSIITPNFVQMIGVSSALHDIGKVGVSDNVLLKPGKLTADERRHMQTHATLGGECIQQIEMRLGNSNFLSTAREIAFHHHERWDGAGYPAGLMGEAIPLAARIVAIVDVYDALVSRRVYKDAFSHEKSIDMIRSEAGKHFDPELVNVFLSIEGQFRAISDRFREEPRVDADLTQPTDNEQDDLEMCDAEERKLLETVRSIHETPLENSEIESANAQTLEPDPLLQ